MSAWKLVVNFSIPPALVLTVLLLLPTPHAVKKGLLALVRKVLFLNVAGNFKLAHVMMVVTGAALAASSVQTYRLNVDAVSPSLTGNQKMAILARKWREERNFWIAFLSFLLWCFLYRFYALVLEHLVLKDRVRALDSQLKQVKAALGTGASTAGAAGTGSGAGMGVPAPDPREPSAPPAPEVDAASWKHKAH